MLRRAGKITLLLGIAQLGAPVGGPVADICAVVLPVTEKDMFNRFQGFRVQDRLQAQAEGLGGRRKGFLVRRPLIVFRHGL